MSDCHNQYALTLRDISDRERKALEDEATNLRPRAPSGPNWPHSRVFSNDVEGARHLAQKDYAESWSMCFVPVCSIVEVADRPGVEFDSQSLARS